MVGYLVVKGENKVNIVFLLRLNKKALDMDILVEHNFLLPFMDCALHFGAGT